MANVHESDEDLFPLVYDQLKAIARRRMAGERKDHTLQATALVHEAWIRLTGADRVVPESRFFRAAARAMRRILIDHARGKGREKRGGDRRRLPLDVLDLAANGAPEEIVAVDEAIRRLEEQDARAAEVVRLRFFAGLDIEGVARVLGCSARTVEREWTYARAWLFRALKD